MWDKLIIFISTSNSQKLHTVYKYVIEFHIFERKKKIIEFFDVGFAKIQVLVNIKFGFANLW